MSPVTNGAGLQLPPNTDLAQDEQPVAARCCCSTLSPAEGSKRHTMIAEHEIFVLFRPPTDNKPEITDIYFACVIVVRSDKFPLFFTVYWIKTASWALMHRSEDCMKNRKQLSAASGCTNPKLTCATVAHGRPLCSYLSLPEEGARRFRFFK